MDNYNRQDEDDYSYSDEQKDSYNNSYGSNNYGSSNNSYRSGYSGPAMDERGRRIGQGFGVASILLGILSLAGFCTVLNILPAILAIVFGIIQLVRYNTKGLAIGGIVTGALSLILCAVFWGLIFTAGNFVNMMEDYIFDYSIEDENNYPDSQDDFYEYFNEIQNDDGMTSL